MEQGNETLRLAYRQNCVDFSTHHGIGALKKKRLRRCNCKRVNEEGVNLSLKKGNKILSPMLQPTYSYKQTADKLGTFDIVFDDGSPIAVIFAYFTGETFITYDMNIVTFLKMAGYRCSNFHECI